jgi:hypothetical protein
MQSALTALPLGMYVVGVHHALLVKECQLYFIGPTGQDFGLNRATALSAFGLSSVHGHWTFIHSDDVAEDVLSLLLYQLKEDL